jgi:hypothetical protein
VHRGGDGKEMTKKPKLIWKYNELTHRWKLELESGYLIEKFSIMDAGFIAGREIPKLPRQVRK